MASLTSSNIVSSSFQAAETIPAFAAVSLTINEQVQNTRWPDLSSVSNFLGISLTPAYSGQFLDICLIGVISNPSWSFVPLQPVYVYSNGMLTQNNPRQAICKIGKAVSSTKLLIYPYESLILNAN